MEAMKTCNDHMWMSLIHPLVRYGYRPSILFRALRESHLLVKLYDPHPQDCNKPLDTAQDLETTLRCSVFYNLWLFAIFTSTCSWPSCRVVLCMIVTRISTTQHPASLDSLP
jgi:hypothetical protein